MTTRGQTRRNEQVLRKVGNRQTKCKKCTQCEKKQKEEIKKFCPKVGINKTKSTEFAQSDKSTRSNKPVLRKVGINKTN